jgi:hypothetical protein
MNFAAVHQNYGYYLQKHKMDYANHEPEFARSRETGNKQFGYSSHNDDYGKSHKYLKGDALDAPHPAGENYRGESFIETGGYMDTFMNKHQKLHNKENFANQLKKPRLFQQGYEVSMEEGEVLLKLWEQNHFIDFNSWLQSAKARVN